MSPKYLHGVVRTGPRLPEAIPSLSPFGQTQVLPYGRLAAMVTDSRPLDIPQAEAGRELFAFFHSQPGAIQEMMRQFTILPARLGTALEDEEEVRLLLEKGYPVLQAALESIEGKVQMEVEATWDVEQILKGMAEEPAIRECLLVVQGKGVETPEGARHEMRRLIREALERRRLAWLGEVLECLGNEALDVQRNPQISENVALSLAILAEARKLREMEKRLGKLESSFLGWLKLRLVGPLPPYSFFCLEVHRVGAEELPLAQRVLEQLERGTPQQVHEAYHQARQDWTPAQATTATPPPPPVCELLLDYALSREEPGRRLWSLLEGRERGLLVSIKKGSSAASMVGAGLPWKANVSLR